MSVQTVSFNEMEVVDVEIQAHLGSGLPSLVVVGLVDKAISEAKERIRTAMQSIAISFTK